MKQGQGKSPDPELRSELPGKIIRCQLYPHGLNTGIPDNQKKAEYQGSETRQDVQAGVENCFYDTFAFAFENGL
jgi:hypothetical protein